MHEARLCFNLQDTVTWVQTFIIVCKLLLQYLVFIVSSTENFVYVYMHTVCTDPVFTAPFHLHKQNIDIMLLNSLRGIVCSTASC